MDYSQIVMRRKVAGLLTSAAHYNPPPPIPYIYNIKLYATGPVAEGLFAATQGVSISAGSWYALAQSIIMVSALPLP